MGYSDMASEMVNKARHNASKANYHNVDFRLGEIENLPVADSVVEPHYSRHTILPFTVR